jgi:hypothetical protein
MNKNFTLYELEKFKSDTEEIKKIYKNLYLKEINNTSPLTKIETYLYIVLVIIGFYLIFKYICIKSKFN